MLPSAPVGHHATLPGRGSGWPMCTCGSPRHPPWERQGLAYLHLWVATPTPLAWVRLPEATPLQAPGDPASVCSPLCRTGLRAAPGAAMVGHVADAWPSAPPHPSAEHPESARLPAVGLGPHQGAPRVPWSCQEAWRKWGELARGSAGGGCPGWGHCPGVSPCPVGGCLLPSCWPAVPARRAPHPRWVPPPPLGAAPIPSASWFMFEGLLGPP